MMSNEKIAHDIAIALLSESLKQTNSELYIFDKDGNGSINSLEITGAYKELYQEILSELNP